MVTLSKISKDSKNTISIVIILLILLAISPFSHYLSIVLQQTPPTAPREVKAVAGNGLVELLWNAPASNGQAPIEKYSIYRSIIPNSETFLISVGDNNIYIDEKVTYETTYYYKIRAINSKGEGALCNEVNATAYTPIWYHTLGLPGNDWANDVVVDSSAVYSGGSTTSNQSINALILKYSSQGDLLWNHTWTGGKEFQRIAINSSSIYVISNDLHYYVSILKYDLDGKLLWNRTWRVDDIEYYRCEAKAIVADATSIYISVNAQERINHLYDVFLLKYDSDGNLIWSRSWGMDNDVNEKESGLTIDSSAVFVTGEYSSPHGYLYNTFILKYNFYGDLLLDGILDDAISPRQPKIVTDSSAIYILGSSWNYSSMRNYITILKLDLNGNLLWSRHWACAFYAIPYNIAIDTSAIYVAGWVGNQTVQPADALILKYDFNGNLLWNRVWHSPYVDLATGISVDSSAIYIVGETGDYNGPTGSDTFILKFSKI